MKALAIFSFILVAVLFTNLALATDISSCTNITSPGYYSLNQSLSINNPSSSEWQNCLLILANNTVIDGNGYTIDGNGTLGTAAYSQYLTNVTIKNLTISNFQTGLSFNRMQNSFISNLTVQNSSWVGIYLAESSYNSLSYLDLQHNNIGVLLGYSSTNNVLTNVSSENDAVGINLHINSNNNRIVGFSSVQDSIAIKSLISSENILKYSNLYGAINFSSLSQADIVGNITFPGTINISNNFVYVNSTAVSGLNISANVTLYNVPTNLVNYSILKDGIACSDCYNFTALNSGNVTFNVSSWSNYAVYGESSGESLSSIDSQIAVLERQISSLQESLKALKKLRKQLAN